MGGISLRFEPSVRVLLPLQGDVPPRADIIGPSFGYEHLRLQTRSFGVELQVLSPLTIGLAITRARLASPHVPVPLITHALGIGFDRRLSFTTDVHLDERAALSFDITGDDARIGLRWTFK